VLLSASRSLIQGRTWVVRIAIIRFREYTMNRITSLGITRASSFWYPIMVAQEAGKLSESKAAELLGIGFEEYRTAKHQAIRAVLELIDNLPSPMVSLWEVIKSKPEFFND